MAGHDLDEMTTNAGGHRRRIQRAAVDNQTAGRGGGQTDVNPALARGLFRRGFPLAADEFLGGGRQNHQSAG
ncbi:hypothetical protein D3877_28595 [Azospirillum cavernae]|uniref:Uncharacterized protein n=1 Tax=Azospirillum cavernae TaxID=2320860 RepID=A0A418VL51_9PROT|nr:hypothetical protein D3877_28595 [Azospirillum cavernae]